MYAITHYVFDPMPSSNSPIGVFDSGVGGLSVLRAMRALMPEESVIYFGDQGHVPYGPRSMEQIQNFSEGITKFLLDHDAKLIVVACNTASAAALTYPARTFSLRLFCWHGACCQARRRDDTGQARWAYWLPLPHFKARYMPRWWNGLPPGLSCSSTPARAW